MSGVTSSSYMNALLLWVKQLPQELTQCMAQYSDLTENSYEFTISQTNQPLTLYHLYVTFHQA